MTNPAYDRLHGLFERIALVENAERALGWDRRTMMPPASGDTRAKVVGTLRTIANEQLCSTEVGDLLDAVEASGDGLSPWQAANLREMRRLRRHVTSVPADLQRAIAELSGRTEAAWEQARRDDDFASYVAPLRAYLALQLEASRIRGAAGGLTPYDALLEEHEPGLRASAIDPLFDDLADFLPKLADRIEARQRDMDPPLPLDGPFAQAPQVDLSRLLATRVGFDFSRGRIDQSAHPYTSIVPGDIRITTRFRTDDVREGIMATIHESGHAMYEAGLPLDWRFQPVGLARGGALHESQALLFEMQAARSTPFLAYLAPQLRQTLGKSGPAWSDGNVLRTYRQLRRTCNRAEADEVGYPLHIILRYRIERRLIEGNLDVADLREAWNAESQALLGVTPASDAQGCLQDPHWVIGYLGYFPVYALGALIAAQLFAAARRDEPGLDAALAGGDFAPLLRWSRHHVHRHASFPPSAADIVEAASGAPLGTAALKAHLQARYLDGAAV